MSAFHASIVILSFGSASLLQGCGGGSDKPTTTKTTTTTMVTTLESTTVITTSTTTATTATNLADSLNALYNQEDDGVLYRCMKAGYDKPWLGGGDHVSFAIMNKFALDPVKKALSMYGLGLLFCLVAKPEVRDSIRCLYPCDGSSNDRDDKGCGCRNSWHCAPGQGDWCGPNDVHQHGAGYPCVLHPNETARMLHLLKEVKVGKGPLVPACQSQWVGPNSNAYTEVVVDIDRWNPVAHNNIQAFFMPNECEANNDEKSKTCWASFWAMWKNWKALYAELPVLRMNRSNIEAPFSVYPMNEAIVV